MAEPAEGEWDDPALRAAFEREYDGPGSAADQWWWLRHPEELAPSGAQPPALRLRAARSAAFRRDATAESIAAGEAAEAETHTEQAASASALERARRSRAAAPDRTRPASQAEGVPSRARLRRRTIVGIAGGVAALGAVAVLQSTLSEPGGRLAFTPTPTPTEEVDVVAQPLDVTSAEAGRLIALAQAALQPSDGGAAAEQLRSRFFSAMGGFFEIVVPTDEAKADAEADTERLPGPVVRSGIQPTAGGIVREGGLSLGRSVAMLALGVVTVRPASWAARVSLTGQSGGPRPRTIVIQGDREVGRLQYALIPVPAQLRPTGLVLVADAAMVWQTSALG